MCLFVELTPIASPCGALLGSANTAFDIRSRFNALSFFETILPPVKTKRTTGSIAKFSLGGNKGSSIKIGLNLKKNMS